MYLVPVRCSISSPCTGQIMRLIMTYEDRDGPGATSEDCGTFEKSFICDDSESAPILSEVIDRCCRDQNSWWLCGGLWERPTRGNQWRKPSHVGCGNRGKIPATPTSDMCKYTTKDCHFDWGSKAHRNGPILGGSSLAFKKGVDYTFFANCLWYCQILKVKKCKYQVLA